MGDEGAGFGSNFAALNAEAAINAVRAISMRTGKDGYRAADGDGYVEGGAAFDQSIADATHRMRTVCVSMRVSPGIVSRPCHRHLQFELFIVGAQNLVR